MTFNMAGNLGRVVRNFKVNQLIKDSGTKRDPVKIQCFPLYSLLLALNQTTVDFLSLDVEGDELYVLKTIPFHKVDIKMMTVEYGHVEEGSEAVVKYVESKGYDALLWMSNQYWAVIDIIFRKRGM